MTGSEDNSKSDDDLKADDLDLVDNSLEDAAKDDAEIWAEIDAEESGAATNGQDPDDAGSTDVGADPDSKADSTAANDTEGDTAADAATSGDKPDDQEDTQGTEQDPWADVNPELKKEFDDAQATIKRLESADKSHRGRTSALQRQLDKLRAASSPPSSSTDDDKGDDAGKSALTAEERKALEDEYPEVATPLLKVIDSLEARLKTQDNTLTSINAERTDDAIAAQEEALLEVHPDWEDVIAADEFGPWLDKQPRHIREAAQRNGSVIVDAEEAADVVGRFKAFRETQTEQDAGNGSDTETDPAKSTNGSDNGNKPTALSGKRQRQLEAASSSRTSSPGVATGIPEDGDPEAIWKAFDKAEQRKAQRA